MYNDTHIYLKGNIEDMQYIIIGIIILGIIVYYQRKLKKTSSTETEVVAPTDELNTGNVYPTVLTTHDINEYYDYFVGNQIPVSMGNILIPPTTYGRYYGAMTAINASTIETRNAMIKNNENYRNHEVRENLEVPGFKGLNTKEMYEAGQRDPLQRNHSLYHKTHLLPYRFSMSEGDTIEGLVFAGTAHLNHGDRPDIDFFPDEKEKEQRNKILRSKLDIDGRISMSYEDVSVSDYNYCNSPEGSNFSLDDFENLASDIISENKNNDPYAYYTWLDYDAENDTAIPNRIYLRLKNLKTHQLLIDVSINNVL